MRTRQIATGMLFAFTAIFSAAPASAGFSICNDAGVPITVAIGWRENNAWSSEGWWNIAPRQCATPLSGPLQNRQYYYYAESSNGALKWHKGPDAGFFCADQENEFYYSLVTDPPCDGYEFRRVFVGEELDYTIRLNEREPDPKQAALNCTDQMARGREDFAECWIRNVASVKQRRILDCWDRTETYSSFAICANEDSLRPDSIKIADCASKFADKREGGEFLSCVGRGQITPDQARVFDCAINNQGSYAAMGSCAIAGQLTPEQRRIYNCVLQNRGNYQNMGLCAATTTLTPQQSRLVSCVMSNRGSYLQMGVCAVGNQLTPEQQVFAQCAISTGGQPYAFAGCVGTHLTVNELEKCMEQGIGGSGCFGDNNTAVKFVKNYWKDVTQGPGPDNDGRRFVERNVVGPVRDIMTGRIGQSDASVWRQIGLPPVNLF